MKKCLIALLIGIVAEVFFLLLTGFAGAACHCNTPLKVLFPFKSLQGVHVDGGTVGDLLFVLQYPVYALIVAMPKGAEWRVGVFVLLFAIHVFVAEVASRMPG